MKVGYSAYGSYGDVYEFLAVGKYIYVISDMYGFLGCASTPEAVATMLIKETNDIAKADIIEAATHAITDVEDVKPFE